MNLDDFENEHLDEDVYVLGSGPSLSYLQPSFFARKVVVATNAVAERLGLYGLTPWLYTHSHYHEETYQLAEKYRAKLFFTPEGDRGLAGTPGRLDLKNVIHYPHKPTVYDFDVHAAWPPAGGLLVGSTSMHGAMHLAAHMGAANIIMVGADCGTINGQANHGEYVSGNLATSEPYQWLSRWDKHLRQVKQALMDHYPGLQVVSLNPFVNLNLEGNHFSGGSRAGLCQTCGMHCADLHA